MGQTDHPETPFDLSNWKKSQLVKNKEHDGRKV